MGLIGKAMRSGMAVKAGRVLKREAAKPENQRRAKDLWAKVTGSGSSSGGGKGTGGRGKGTGGKSQGGRTAGRNAGGKHSGGGRTRRS